MNFSQLLFKSSSLRYSNNLAFFAEGYFLIIEVKNYNLVLIGKKHTHFVKMIIHKSLICKEKRNVKRVFVTSSLSFSAESNFAPNWVNKKIHLRILTIGSRFPCSFQVIIEFKEASALQ